MPRKTKEQKGKELENKIKLEGSRKIYQIEIIIL